MQLSAAARRMGLIPLMLLLGACAQDTGVPWAEPTASPTPTPAPTAPPPLYTHQRLITVDGTLLNEDLLGFPLLLRINDPNLGTHITPEAANVSFFAATDGEPLPFELQRFDPGTGDLTAWVRVPELRSGEDSLFWMRYGGADLDVSGQDAQAWDDAFEGVYHLDEPSDSPLILDSTSFSRPGASSGPPQLGVDGQVGTAMDCTGDNYEHANLGNVFNFPATQAWTLSMWTKGSEIPANFPRLASKRAGAGPTDNGFTLEQEATSGQITFIRRSEGTQVVARSGAPLSLVEFTHIAAVYTGQLVELFINGELADAKLDTGIVGDIASDFKICAEVPVTDYNGVIDEVRVSSTARGASWIGAEYLNQSVGSSLFEIGPEQPIGL